MSSHTVYEPQEDSFLLMDSVKKYARGDVLDMGTGSGIQGFCVVGDSFVTFADKNPDALSVVKDKLGKSDMYECVLTDLFSNISRVYDTIIFNAPYLPNDQDVVDIALDGGEQGYEVTLAFLRYAKYFLRDDGCILLLISELTQPRVVEKFILEYGYAFEIISRKKISFDELFVYKISLSQPHLLSHRVFFARGNRGLVFRGTYKNHDAVEKIRNPLAEVDTIANEIRYLEILNKHGIGPQLLYYDPHVYIRAFVDGQLIEDFILSSSVVEISSVLRAVLEQCYIMDSLRINKREMNHPHKHILITQDQRVFQIDFERCHETKKPKNVTQFVQYICGGLTPILIRKEIVYERETMIALCSLYKKDFSRVSFEKILSELNL